MIAVDTNLLVYAHREDAPFHKRAKELVEGLAAKRHAWGIPWPCVHEFFAIVTHPRIYKPPTPPATALKQLRALAAIEGAGLLGEIDGHLEKLQEFVVGGRVFGGAIHDARIASICALHGVTEFWSVDRDFSRYPGLPARNPLPL